MAPHRPAASALRPVQAADWQLGKPYGSFDSEVRAAFNEVRFDAINAIGQAAALQNSVYVLVADTFDHAAGALDMPATYRKLLGRYRPAEMKANACSGKRAGGSKARGWWKPPIYFRASQRGKLPFAHEGAVALMPASGEKPPVRFRASHRGNLPFVQEGAGGSNARGWWRAACPLSDERRKKADVRSGDKVGGLDARRWWKAGRSLQVTGRKMQTFVQSAG